MSHRSRESKTGSMMDSNWRRIEPALTDQQWSLISDLFPDRPVGPHGGRPRISNRACIEGILWVLRSGARWKDLPSQFPSYVTCWRRFAKWSSEGLWDVALSRLLETLDRKGRINWNEGFADATFASAKKGAIASARHVEVKEPRSWFSPTATEFPWQSMSNLQTVPKSS